MKLQEADRVILEPQTIDDGSSAPKPIRQGRTCLRAHSATPYAVADPCERPQHACYGDRMLVPCRLGYSDMQDTKKLILLSSERFHQTKASEPNVTPFGRFSGCAREIQGKCCEVVR
jgi:hypothetical protein